MGSAQPGISSLILGVSKLEQLEKNIASLAVTLSQQHLDTLNRASALEPANPYAIFSDAISRSIFGGVDVEGWPIGRRHPH